MCVCVEMPDARSPLTSVHTHVHCDGVCAQGVATGGAFLLGIPLAGILASKVRCPTHTEQTLLCSWRCHSSHLDHTPNSRLTHPPLDLQTNPGGFEIATLHRRGHLRRQCALHQRIPARVPSSQQAAPGCRLQSACVCAWFACVGSTGHHAMVLICLWQWHGKPLLWRHHRKPTQWGRSRR